MNSEIVLRLVSELLKLAMVLSLPPRLLRLPRRKSMRWPVPSPTPALLRRGGQRVGTLLMYLSTPNKGGGTTFPDAHVEVAPIKGQAVFFSYERPHPMTRTLHGAAPVSEGEKWVATKWLRERPFK